MSKELVQKALNLLQEDLISENSKEKNCPSSLHKKKKKKALKSQKVNYPDLQRIPKDRTEENLLILEQLRCLKPKTSVAQKVVEFYCKRKDYSEEPVEEIEPKSILFDDDDDAIKKKKKRKR